MPQGADSAARRYADAVFEIAETADRLDAWADELELLAGAFAAADVLSWLTDPAIPAADKEQLIQTGFASASQEARNLGCLLVTRGRADLATQILMAYRSRLDDARGIVHARITSAVALSDRDTATVQDRLATMTGREVKIEMIVDPSIIGGLVVRMGDKLIDASARARLIELKRRLAGTSR